MVNLSFMSTGQLGAPGMREVTFQPMMNLPRPRA